jgi:hypothetical protein
MYKAHTIKLAGVAATVLLVAGCATTSGNLADAAHRLDRSADALYSEVRRDNRDQGLERDARAMADVAHDFHRDVKERATREELQVRFDRVASSYHALRDEFGDARSSDSRSDSRERSSFGEVTRAYLDLERELQYRQRVSTR